MMPEIGVFDIVGFFGVACLVGAYFANQQRWLESTDWRYPAINLAGAILIGTSLIDAWNFPSAVIEVFWGAISIYGMVRAIRSRRHP